MDIEKIINKHVSSKITLTRDDRSLVIIPYCEMKGIACHETNYHDRCPNYKEIVVSSRKLGE